MPETTSLTSTEATQALSKFMAVQELRADNDLLISYEGNKTVNTFLKGLKSYMEDEEIFFSFLIEEEIFTEDDRGRTISDIATDIALLSHSSTIEILDEDDLATIAADHASSRPYWDDVKEQPNGEQQQQVIKDNYSLILKQLKKDLQPEGGAAPLGLEVGAAPLGLEVGAAPQSAMSSIVSAAFAATAEDDGTVLGAGFKSFILKTLVADARNEYKAIVDPVNTDNPGEVTKAKEKLATLALAGVPDETPGKACSPAPCADFNIFVAPTKALKIHPALRGKQPSAKLWGNSKMYTIGWGPMWANDAEVQHGSRINTLLFSLGEEICILDTWSIGGTILHKQDPTGTQTSVESSDEKGRKIFKIKKHEQFIIEVKDGAGSSSVLFYHEGFPRNFINPAIPELARAMEMVEEDMDQGVSIAVGGVGGRESIRLKKKPKTKKERKPKKKTRKEKRKSHKPKPKTKKSRKPKTKKKSCKPKRKTKANKRRKRTRTRRR